MEQQNEDEYFKEHFFDQIDMLNPESRARRDDITRGIGPLRGVQGIRQKFYKVQEDQIPMEQRIGIMPVDNVTNNDSEWFDSSDTH